MTNKYRIRIKTSRGYSGYFWDVERCYLRNDTKDGVWIPAIKGGYAFTKWGAMCIARHRAKKLLQYEPFERIEELN